MNKRKGMSKKIRFEVFKRDSFSCQYCGATPSTTELEVDHIQPVATGGGNDMLNLITSCFDCNRGKSARELSDDSVVVKQKKQLDNLQERRQQLEMMLEWRKGLDGLKSETNLMVIEYIESKIRPYTINDFGKKKLERVINKYVLEEVLEAVTVAETRYLRYGDDEVLERSSVDNFITKITGILVNSKRSPVDQKVAYIIGICRNRFDYWNHKVGASLLKKAQLAMSNDGRTDESVLEVLTDTLQPMALESRNWTQWKGKIEYFLETLESQPVEGLVAPDANLQGDAKPGTQENLIKYVDSLLIAANKLTPTLVLIGQQYEGFKEEFFTLNIASGILNYLQSAADFYDTSNNEQSNLPNFDDEFRLLGMYKMFGLENADTTFVLEMAYSHVLKEMLPSIEKYWGDIELTSEDYTFMAKRFHGRINWELIRTKLNNSEAKNHADQEDLISYVDDFLIVRVYEVVPALVFIRREFKGFQIEQLDERIGSGILNHLNLFWEEFDKPSEKKVKTSLRDEFIKLGILSFPPTDSWLADGLQQAYRHLLKELMSIDDYCDWSGITVTAEDCDFIRKRFKKSFQERVNHKRAAITLEEPEDDSNVTL